MSEWDYRADLAKPIEEIHEDIFYRADSFQTAPWYGDFQLFRSIGVCTPAAEHALEVRKALKLMGYPTHTSERDGKTFILPGEARQTGQNRQSPKHRDRER